MNTIKTSKKALLDESKKIAAEKGLKSINIRELAKSANVSIGTVYNYFPSKADLMAETVGVIWEDIFHIEKCSERKNDFIENIEWIFNCIQIGSKEYPSFFMIHSISFADGEKATGKKLMNSYFDHIKKGLMQSLCEDKNIKATVFSDDFTREMLVDFVFSNVMALSSDKKSEYNTLIEIIKRLIYQG